MKKYLRQQYPVVKSKTLNVGNRSRRAEFEKKVLSIDTNIDKEQTIYSHKQLVLELD